MRVSNSEFLIAFHSIKSLPLPDKHLQCGNIGGKIVMHGIMATGKIIGDHVHDNVHIILRRNNMNIMNVVPNQEDKGTEVP